MYIVKNFLRYFIKLNKNIPPSVFIERKLVENQSEGNDRKSIVCFLNASDINIVSNK